MAAAVAVAIAPPRASRRAPEPRRRKLPRWSASASSGATAALALSSRTAALDATVTAAAARKGVKEYVDAAREMVRRPDGGPPRWFAPLECGGGRASGAPPLLYLPGIDGVGMGLIRHHERLGKIFETWCLHIPVDDRTPFEGLVEYVESTVKSEGARALDRPIYLVGESIGACIALAVAARNPDIDFVLILVNPGTSFKNSQLQPLSDLLHLVPEPFHLTVPHFLNFLTGNFIRMSSAFAGRGFSGEEVGQTSSESNTSMLQQLRSLMFLVDVLPKESIVWKLKMLRTASSFVNSRLHAVKAQTLVLASGNDELLPSREEAERLRSALANCRIRHFKDNGHKILLESGPDIVTIIKGAGYYRRSRQIDFVSDYISLTPDEFKMAANSYRIYDFATSPVMLSTLSDGKVVRGYAGLPKEGPVIFVGYHMLMGYELGPLVTRLLSHAGIHIRGLAHPFMFNKSSEHLMPDSSSFDLYRIMGAAPVSAANFYKLLSRKCFVLLYPGGAREALHRKGEEYKLFWPEQSEFVRMASRFGATIIPFGVVGEDDLFELVLDYNDLLKIPYYDILDKMINEDAIKLRADSTGELKNQDLHSPLILPKVPGRLYFFFGKAIETRGREKELRDRENAHRLYLHAKSEVERCINYLKEKRENDPYRSMLPRLLYQAIHGLDAEIPTFEL